MKKTEKVAKAVWLIGMSAFTLWIVFTLYIPALSQFSSGLGWLAVTLFTIAVWGFVGVGVSYATTFAGFILGFIAEGIVALRNHYKRA